MIADLGIMCAGGSTTTVYPTTEPADATYIIADSASKVLFAENPAQAAKIAGADLPALTHVVLLDGTADASATVPSSPSPSWRSGATARWPPSPS
ncbi:hypothetical protein GCM10027614_25890 [Micromonospora vulcania]